MTCLQVILIDGSPAAKRATTATTSPSPQLTQNLTASEQSLLLPSPENDRDEQALYEITCHQSAINNGIYNFKECRIIQVNGSEKKNEANAPQQVGAISVHGIDPAVGANVSDNTQHGINNISPFETVYSNAGTGPAVTEKIN